MKLQALLNFLESIAPPSLAMDWDNVGLMVGDPDWDISKALVALDAGEAAVDLAISEGCNLILSHHPLIFRPIRHLTDPLLIKLVTHRIAVISLHTNLDVADKGVNHVLASRLNLSVEDVLDQETGLGLVGSLPQPMTLTELAEHTKKSLQCPSLMLWTAGLKPDAQVRQIAICGGAGGSLITLAGQQAELLICGDISYHSYLSSPIPLIDAGHFYTEYPVLERLSQVLSSLKVPHLAMPLAQHEFPRFFQVL